jgi:hypothetical protein
MEQFSYTLGARFSGKTYFSLKVKFLQNVSELAQENCSIIFFLKNGKIEN